MMGSPLSDLSHVGSHETVNPDGDPSTLLVCDHASNAVPRALDGLGLGHADLERHIAWDIGAGALTRRLSALLNFPAVLSRFSRLVIDPNRALDHPASIPAVSDGVPVPGNRDLGLDERARRAALFHRPYHAAIDRRIALQRGPGAPALLSIHSFTPVMDGRERPWHVSVLHDDDRRLSDAALAALRRSPGIVVGDNEPYTGYSDLTFTLPHHAARHDLPSAAIEMRQDLIDTPAGVETWALRLADALAAALADPRARAGRRPGADPAASGA